MTQSTFATLSYQGVTGLAFVQLDDDGHDRTLLPSSPAHVAQLRLRPSFVDELQRRGNNLVHQLEEATSSVNKLLAPENRQAILDSINSVKTAAQSVNRVAQQLDARHPRHALITHHEVYAKALQELERLIAARGGEHVILVAEDGLQRVENPLLVVDEQDARLGGLGALCGVGFHRRRHRDANRRDPGGAR